MNIQVDSAWLLAMLLASTRILAWVSIAPPFATSGLPRTMRAIYSVGLALAVAPLAQRHVPAQQVEPILASLVVQIGLGAGLGFLTRLIFSVVETAGSLLDVFGGFSLSAAYDPMNTTMNSVFGRFYALLCTTLIFATNVHLVIIGGFLRTFSTVPLNAGFSMNALAANITTGVTELFVAALQIAGPLIVVLFLADVSLGVLNRIAPQLNAFSMSFPIKIGLTLLLVGMGFTLMPQTIVDLADRTTQVVAAVTTG